MKITLNGKDYQLKFGVRFIRELDKKYFFGPEEIHFGTGVQSAFQKLQSHDPVMLFDVLAASLATQTTFTDGDFDAFFEAKNEQEINDLFADLVKNLERQPMTAAKIKEYKANIKKAANQMNPQVKPTEASK